MTGSREAMTEHRDRQDVPRESPQRTERPDPDGSPGRRAPFGNDTRDTGTSPGPSAGRDEAPTSDRRRRGDSPWMGGG